MGKARAPGCGACFFRKKQFVGSRGPIDAEIVIVGEGPGATELREGIPFVGDSGEVLEQCLPEGVSSKEFYITNAMQCLPIKFPKKTAENKKNLGYAAHRCHQRLVDEISRYPRKVIITLGNSALWSLTNNYDLKITQVQGQTFASDLAEHGIVVTVHPAYLLHSGGSGGMVKKFKSDLEYAIRLARGGKIKTPIKHTYEIVKTQAHVKRVLKEMRLYSVETGDSVVAADAETGGLNHRFDEILCVGFCIDPRKVYIIPEEKIELFQILIGQKEFKWCWHNGKFDAKFFRHIGIECKVDEDTMLLNYSLNESRGFHDLEQIAGDLIGAPDYKHMLKPYLPNKQTSYREIPKPILYEYLAYDATFTKQIFTILSHRVEEDTKSSFLYRHMLLRASELLIHVEETGIFIDSDRVAENKIYYTKKIAEQAEFLNDIAASVGMPGVNANSWQQVAELLYKHLKLGPNKGTGKDILEKLPPHPAVEAILEHRSLAKGYGTYVKSIKKHLHPDDGRVHQSFLIHGTQTGRLSCKDPNTMNIPRDPRLRGQYIAAPGYTLVEVDLNQAELRVLAVLSGDPALCKIYNTPGLSIHKEVSKDLWGDDWADRYSLDDPDDPVYLAAYEEYMRTKAVNFGIIYGREAPSIAKEFMMPRSDAQNMIDGWSSKFPQAWDFLQRCKKAPLLGQDLTTVFGRRKRHGVVTRQKLKDLQNQAANFPPQSIASDINLDAACRVLPEIKEVKARIINLIHDSTLFEIPASQEAIEYVIERMGYYMVQIPIEFGLTRVPFISDAKEGSRWGSLHDYKSNKLAA